MNRQLSTRLSSLELREDSEILTELRLGVTEVMTTLLSRRAEWAEQLRRFGHPRKWPANLGRWDPDAGDYEILDDLYSEWLELPKGSSAFVVEPWYVGITREERMQRSYLRSYHGPEWDYTAGLATLIAMRPDWVRLQAKYGHPKRWPENAGRWAKGEHDAVVLEHLAVEWEREWERRVERVGVRWFLLRTAPSPRLPDPAALFHALPHRGVA